MRDKRKESRRQRERLANVDVSRVVYGKYWTRRRGGVRTNEDNALYVHRPARATLGGLLPFILHFHGGGFHSGGAFTEPNARIEAAVASGAAFVTVNYRLVGTRYWYDEPGASIRPGASASAANGSVEELIVVDEAGRLSLDPSGRTMDAYRVRVGRTEFMTKCTYDAVAALEHILQHARDLNLDVHRISVDATSAGGGPAAYLLWVYHQWHATRYTPLGLVVSSGQLLYPVQNALEDTWRIFSERVGPAFPLSGLIDADACETIVGNPWCARSPPARSRSPREIGGPRGRARAGATRRLQRCQTIRCAIPRGTSTRWRASAPAARSTRPPSVISRARSAGQGAAPGSSPPPAEMRAREHARRTGQTCDVQARRAGQGHARTVATDAAHARAPSPSVRRALCECGERHVRQ